MHVTHSNTGNEYQATFDQSTTIGKVDELAQSRLSLLELYSGGPATPLSKPAAAEPPQFTIPAPVAGPPQEAEAVPADRQGRGTA